MDPNTVDSFVDALHALERDGDVEPLVALFTDGTELRKLDHHTVSHGRDGARDFWREYRSAFGEIWSEFATITVGEQSAALEWTSTGTTAGGEAISYTGVSVLDGGDGTITGFRTYYDSAAFLDRAHRS